MSGYTPIGDGAEAPPGPPKDDYTAGGERSLDTQPHPYSAAYSAQQRQKDPSQAIQISPHGYPTGADYGEPTAGPSTFSSQEGGQRISRYETSLPLRYDVEAAMAYVLGLFSGALLLILEKKNDYVRFHAWQASLFSAGSFVALFVVALIADFLYWLVLLSVVAVQIYMARRAYLDGAIFERFALPYVGPLSAQFVDEE